MVLLLTLVSLGVFGQDAPATRRPQRTESPYYSKTVFINRIISTQQGYRVQYWNSRLQPIVAYIPIEWFSRSNPDIRTEDGNSKAELLLGDDAAYPYMTIYWKDGKFHHVRLYVRRDYGDPSWGVLPGGVSIADQFDPTKDPEFKF